MIMVVVMGIFQIAAASDLFVVADKTAEEMSLSWFSFLEAKEISYKVVAPEDFGNHKKESYIVVMGAIEGSDVIRNIAKDALSADDLKKIEGNEKGKAFFKSDVWAPRQKVILFLGTDQEAAIEARKGSKSYWYGLFMDWFELEGTEGLHLY